MAKTGNEWLAESLANAQRYALGNILESSKITPKQRTFLVKQGYLKKIIRGWYLLDADLSVVSAGDSALWNESLWAFIGQYVQQKFSQQYCLSPEVSLGLLTGNNAFPKQLVIFIDDISPRKIDLPNNLSLLLISSSKPSYQTTQFQGVIIHTLESALVAIGPSFFHQNSLTVHIALLQANMSELEKAIVSSKNQAAGNRLIGAYFALNKPTVAEGLQYVMQSMGFQAVAANNPFSTPPLILEHVQRESPSALRIRLLWQKMRGDVLACFADIAPPHDFKQRSQQELEETMQHVYVSDAYHSLSIEGYQVTTELISRIAQGDWSPESLQQDRSQRDALAAKGYYDAFYLVKDLLLGVHQSDRFNLQDTLNQAISRWYRALFQPCVNAGIINALDLAGFRKGPIYIRGSLHTPPPSEQLMDCMEALKDLLSTEDDFIVKAILGHFFLGYIHPFPDGNGRTARFLMNFLLLLGGYDWLVINHNTRVGYIAALEQASVDKDIRPFADFIKQSIVEQATPLQSHE